MPHDGSTLAPRLQPQRLRSPRLMLCVLVSYATLLPVVRQREKIGFVSTRDFSNATRLGSNAVGIAGECPEGPSGKCKIFQLGWSAPSFTRFRGFPVVQIKKLPHPEIRLSGTCVQSLRDSRRQEPQARAITEWPIKSLSDDLFFSAASWYAMSVIAAAIDEVYQTPKFREEGRYAWSGNLRPP